jgi:glycerol uptake facilitator-like aquaporin
MPGLLEQPAENAPRALWYAALAAEFLGVFFFGAFGDIATAGNGAVGNGFLLAVLAYATAKVSGGHLNPCMSFAATLTGHASVSRALAYMGAQIGGNVASSLLLQVLVPGAPRELGCHAPAGGASLGQAFAFEFLMTLLLILTVYAVAIGEPSFGNVGPFAIGLSVTAGAITAGQFGGGAMNPARILGPAIVSGGCGSWAVAFTYVAAQMLAGAVAALLSAPLYGTGLELGSWADAACDKAGEAREALAAGYERVEGAVGTVRDRLAGAAHQA